MTEGTRPAALSATDAARAIADGRLTSESLVRDCLARIAERDGTVRAWTHLDGEAALARARAADAGPPKGPLHGVPVGIKDIFDVAGMPAERGSPIHRGRRPAASAACVLRAEQAGAVILGKTVTTEFACFHPGPTANPANPAHTPGGSSSGSAAAVADGQVPLAYGSQTVGSVIRPAAFCGVVGMKLTQGRVPLDGTMALSPSFDTLGAFARQARDLFLLLEAWTGEAARPAAPARPRFGWCRTPLWDVVDPAYRDHLARLLDRLRAAGADIVPFDLPVEFDHMREVHRAIFTVEARAALDEEWTRHRDLLSPKLRELLAEGEARPAGEAAEARAVAQDLRRRFDALTAGLDAVLAPSAAGEAPPGLDHTGDPSLNGQWTLLHGPLVHVPHGRGPAGLPLGIQLVGRRGEDAPLVALAAWMERALASRSPAE